MTHVARSTFIIALFFGLDKVLGFLRQALVTRAFGLSYEIDAFNAANNKANIYDLRLIPNTQYPITNNQ